MRAVLACLLLATVSLLLPSEPSYDPWAWLVWGRELSSGTLDTVGGPSWKPLPVIFTALFGRLDAVSMDLPPALWLILARASGLLALVIAFRLAARLAGGKWAPVAGVVAVAALLLSPHWIRYLAHGNEAPMAVCLILAAIERHLDGRHRWALVLGALAALLRPEVFVLLCGYAAWCAIRRASLTPLAAGVVVIVPLLWVVPEWVGAGNPLDAGRQAASAPAWTLAAKDDPWLAALERLVSVLGAPVLVLLAAAAVLGARQGKRTLTALAALALGASVIYVVSTQAGLSGNARYLSLALALSAVVAGAGAAAVLDALPRRGGRLLPALACAGLLVTVPWVAQRGGKLSDRVAETARVAEAHRDLDRAIALYGGPSTVLRRGVPATNRVFETHLAWSLGLTLDSAGWPDRRSIVLLSSLEEAAPPPGPRRRGVTWTRVAGVGTWTVFTRRRGPILAAFQPQSVHARDPSR